MTHKKNLLFLGYGDLASRTVNLLSPHRYNSIGIRRSTYKDKRVSHISADITNLNKLRKVIEIKPDIIVLTMTTKERSLYGYQNSYLKAARTVSELIMNDFPQCNLIYTSSTSVYGQDNGEWISENSDTNPISDTAKVLLETEQYLQHSSKNANILRFSGIYGPGRTSLLDRVIQGEKPNESPQRWTNRIHADDCARAISHCIKQNIRNQVILASDHEPAPLMEVQDWLYSSYHSLPLAQDKPAQDKYDTSSLAGKRCNNKLLLSTGFEFKFPTFRDGYVPLIEDYKKNLGSN